MEQVFGTEHQLYAVFSSAMGGAKLKTKYQTPTENRRMKSRSKSRSDSDSAEKKKKKKAAKKKCDLPKIKVEEKRKPQNLRPSSAKNLFAVN